MKNIDKFEESLIFMSFLTIVGGFINAYAYFIRGNAFVSLHTGNMVKIGIATYLKDYYLFISAIVPVIGCILGAIFAQFIKYFYKKNANIINIFLGIEIIILFIIGFIPTTFSHNIVNFILSIITTFQLSSFRKYNGNVHNSTIMTGNLRTFGGYLADVFIKNDEKNLEILKKYSILIFSFPFGVILGGFFTSHFHIYSIWICCILLFILLVKNRMFSNCSSNKL